MPPGCPFPPWNPRGSLDRFSRVRVNLQAFQAEWEITIHFGISCRYWFGFKENLIPIYYKINNQILPPSAAL
jgi:hypothetical protein